MTQEDIIRMAREAGGTAYTNRHCPGETAMAFGPQALERFVQLVAANAAAAEREALESTQPENPHSIESKAIKSLRQAIASAEHEEAVYTKDDLDRAFSAGLVEGEKLAIETPAAQRQWVGLTLTEMENLRAQFGSWNYPTSLLVAVENILEKKNT